MSDRASDKIKVILGYFLFSFTKRWRVMCTQEQFVNTMKHSMYFERPKKIFPDKRLFGYFYEDRRLFDIIDVYASNYSISSWLYRMKSTVSYEQHGDNETIVTLRIFDKAEYVIFGLFFIFIALILYDQFSLEKTLFVSLITSYFFCVVFFYFSAIRTWSVISDVIGYTRAKIKRY